MVPGPGTFTVSFAVPARRLRFNRPKLNAFDGIPLGWASSKAPTSPTDLAAPLLAGRSPGGEGRRDRSPGFRSGAGPCGRTTVAAERSEQRVHSRLVSSGTEPTGGTGLDVVSLRGEHPVAIAAQPQL